MVRLRVINVSRLSNTWWQNVPDELKNKTVKQIILTFLTPPVGSLIVAMVATYGIYLASSFLYVSPPLPPVGIASYMFLSVIPGICSPASPNILHWRLASPTF